ncbi:MAG: hypothetical protein AAB728_01685, partial [Patescibacteria group bacterium]
AWAWWGLFLLWEGGEWLLKDRRGWRSSSRVLLAAGGVIGVIVAFPFLRQTVQMAQHPLYEVLRFRSGLYSSRLPESWIRSTLFLGMSAGLLGALWKRGTERRHFLPALLAVIAAFVVLNQQVMHGKVLFFSSHYLFPLIFAGVTCFLLSGVLFLQIRRLQPPVHILSTLRRLKPPVTWLLLSFCSSMIFLAGIAWDGRYIFHQWRVTEGNFSEQYLADLLPVLERLPRSRILSDQQSSLFVAGHTRHDVLYSFYLKNVMISDEEFAERSCMTRLLQQPETRSLGQVGLLHQEMFGRDPTLREKDIAFLTRICGRLDRDPAAAIEQYGVQYILWNKAWAPQWNLSRAKVPLE